MSDCPITTFTVSIPTTTYQRLEKLAARQNSPLGNCLSCVVNDGIDTIIARWPNLAEDK